jgi:hypothetical protein
MIKKITLIIIFSFIIISCGKKGNPEYKDLEKKAKIQNIFINRA